MKRVSVVLVGLLCLGLLLGCPQPASFLSSTYTVTYSGNSNTGGSVPTDSNNYLQGATVTVEWGQR